MASAPRPATKQATLRYFKSLLALVNDPSLNKVLAVTDLFRAVSIAEGRLISSGRYAEVVKLRTDVNESPELDSLLEKHVRI